MEARSPIVVDVYADVVCPWCYIGERRFAQALAQRPDLAVERRWQPFQLQPDLPASGVPWRPFAARKFGSWDRAQAAFEHVRRAAADDGITFHFDRIATAPNTVDAHRLILFAARQDKTWEMAASLFRAYFAEGCDLNDRSDLVGAAVRAGLEAETVQALLESDELAGEVARSQRTAQQRGITGVPFFVFNDRYALSGAQPTRCSGRPSKPCRRG